MVNRCIVTSIVGGYELLFGVFAHSLIRFGIHDEIHVLTNDESYQSVLRAVTKLPSERAVYVHKAMLENGLPSDDSSQGCAMKYRIWDFLPRNIYSALFLDIDIVVTSERLAKAIEPMTFMQRLVVVEDEYSGYRERMHEEFSCMPLAWSPSCTSSGKQRYCNTGLIFSTRNHRAFFAKILSNWKTYVSLRGSNPSLWDQNIFNYSLDTGAVGESWATVILLNRAWNCLKEYEPSIDLDLGYLADGDQEVATLHMNGGDLFHKYARRARVLPILLS